ncbi:MAG: DUF4230 domain-containing protein [Chitinophagaceae bacterium]|nr:DUF4230 domain-containing protein [Chitinophagaceae bacterium]
MVKKILLILLFATGCSKKQEQKEILSSLREMSDLATVEYTVTKIIKANDNKTWFKIGERKILISCEAHIKAGVDLAGITEKNFTIHNKDVRLILPPPKIISLSIPAETINVEFQEVSFFRDAFKTAERDELASQAETQIRNSIDSLGILQQAKINTSLFLNNLLVRLGYQNISISYAGDQSLNNADEKK